MASERASPTGVLLLSGRRGSPDRNEDEPVDGDQLLFDFETDFAGTLRCIPMIVRLKLDLCGVKLSLRQWSRFSLSDREELVARGCEGQADVEAYRIFLVDLILVRAHEAAVDAPLEDSPAWRDISQVPERVLAQARVLQLPAPSTDQWRELTQLQRFALVKLARPGHDNDNFLPAMREFRLLDQRWGSDFEPAMLDGVG